MYVSGATCLFNDVMISQETKALGNHGAVCVRPHSGVAKTIEFVRSRVIPSQFVLGLFVRVNKGWDTCEKIGYQIQSLIMVVSRIQHQQSEHIHHGAGNGFHVVSPASCGTTKCDEMCFAFCMALAERIHQIRRNSTNKLLVQMFETNPHVKHAVIRCQSFLFKPDNIAQNLPFPNR